MSNPQSYNQRGVRSMKIGTIVYIPFEIERITETKNGKEFYLKHRWDNKTMLNCPPISENDLNKKITE